MSKVQVPTDATEESRANFSLEEHEKKAPSFQKESTTSNSKWKPKLNWKTPSKKLADESDLITRLGA